MRHTDDPAKPIAKLTDQISNATQHHGCRTPLYCQAPYYGAMGLK